MLKIAVIGVGNMGKNHLRVYSNLPTINLVAIAEIDENIGNKIAKKFQTKLYKDYKKLVNDERPDAVSICVQTSLHFEIAKYCLSQGIHILLEKPITTNVREGKKLISLAKKNTVNLLVGHIERYNPAVRKVKEMIDKGDLGKITAITARRVGGFPPQIRDVNICADLAIHDIDIINFLLDEFPKEISVNKQRVHIRKRDDSVEFFMKYKNASAYIQTNWITPVKIRKLNITGTEGYLEMDYVSQKIEFYKSNYSKFKEESKDFSDFVLLFSQPDKIDITVAKKEPLKEEISYFLNCIENKIKIDSSFAVEALKIALS
ncbi:hypothetical protein A3C98_02650 [Candidatus Roizmanbacteria bacterium RIFCSPHIGHO2_02_FULL_37_15]|uniref:Gfo/Idh/MocA-like oxidoreductase N-terminal domain-containing protein n=1 Tax=Candidatus Roizmanbacteria bacterium RIFCSPLOWO2_01_FULL_37_16 TaxID=1802058 RepID=A0A1F7ILX8_9BACT|nr:MAG: hypothetical protein A3C98_02650 [Candidatus Roizmanbacteria bacterium RIFCSPHIGHO2_02_FULL_37_15]OGK31850.1 MAG: hypothetical protein A3F57_01865 [Candidatus Roizmanbacteria bacterium RIFCSPHIGHO2_12_FULL_36_11]OGK44345.1 MAG: hypothetical protein A3B40_01835 [Candidatus Roizmanbacteria bacterium RIFCSPLOWO2_01_FULL_37_16]